MHNRLITLLWLLLAGVCIMHADSGVPGAAVAHRLTGLPPSSAYGSGTDPSPSARSGDIGTIDFAKRGRNYAHQRVAGFTERWIAPYNEAALRLRIRSAGLPSYEPATARAPLAANQPRAPPV